MIGALDQRRAAVIDFLASHHVMSLALCADGAPRCCSLMYVHDGFALSFVSDPDSRHSRIIDAAKGLPAAVTIAPDYDDFRAIRGLQLTGIVARAGSTEATAALASFARRYAFFRGEKPPALVAAMAKARLYRFTPACITFIDNTTGFGEKMSFNASELATPLPNEV